MAQRVNCLLDTCALIELTRGGEGFSSAARELLQSRDTAVFVSVVSAAELSIKVGKGRLSLSHSVGEFFELAVARHKLFVLPLELGPACQAGGLPWIHADPFDRLLIATARARRLVVVTSDRIIPAYPDLKTIW